MQHQEIEPPATLREAIRNIWYIHRDFEEQQPSFEVTPDGYAELIFTFGSPCSIATPSGWQPLSSPILVGLLSQPIQFRVYGRLEVIGVKCFPWAVAELLGLVLSQAGVQGVTPALAHLQAPLQQLLADGQVAGALATLAQHLVHTQAQRVADPLLSKAGSALLAASGTLPVSQVAAAAHTTVRTLERKFKQAAGRTVKGVAHLVRLEQARSYLWQHPDAMLASVAQEFGYSDQSHLGREFKRYYGLTPAAFARQAQRWQQTVSPDFVAFLLA
jgi:AraC-like DNA-binding protein